MIIKQNKLFILILVFTIFALKISGQNAPARIVAGIPV
jgi:hypothetical protein